ncbi:hypothetical protein ACK8P5_12740 [Paenibacillus sp. EC2-1]|uniref:hypothetical protein n=1 Tax=Paenibacillus sp. EC2-1 TaxID=3388665 RepID=UPI003BEEB89E
MKVAFPHQGAASAISGIFKDQALHHFGMDIADKYWKVQENLVFADVNGRDRCPWYNGPLPC